MIFMIFMPDEAILLKRQKGCDVAVLLLDLHHLFNYQSCSPIYIQHFSIIVHHPPTAAVFLKIFWCDLYNTQEYYCIRHSSCPLSRSVVYPLNLWRFNLLCIFWKNLENDVLVVESFYFVMGSMIGDRLKVTVCGDTVLWSAVLVVSLLSYLPLSKTMPYFVIPLCGHTVCACISKFEDKLTTNWSPHK